MQQGAYAMGTIGLCYETLFLYNPLTDEYLPGSQTAASGWMIRPIN
jgi:hypothetical protein